MKRKRVPSVRVLRRLLRLDPETGKLYWRTRPAWMFQVKKGPYPKSHYAQIWNTRFADTEAFTATFSRPRNYRKGAIFGDTHQAHRIVFALHYGRWPEGEVDHINGDGGDNRPKNLRDVSPTQNQRNRPEALNNTSGATGVYWSKRRRRWYAQIKVARKPIHLGSFVHKSDAIAARKAAELKFCFHPNHGRQRRG